MKEGPAAVSGSFFKISCTRKARLGKPQRMSVCPVASHTRTPVGIGIIAAFPGRA